MRKEFAALIALAMAACQQPHSPQTKADELYLFPSHQRMAMRAKERDADIILEHYDPARDQVAAIECKASYTGLFLSAHGASIPSAEQRRLETYGRIGYARAEALTGKPHRTDADPFNDERIVDLYAYLARHNYRLGGMSLDEKDANLARLKARIALCDKALTAWGAPQVDEGLIRDSVARKWDSRDPASADKAKN